MSRKHYVAITLSDIIVRSDSPPSLGREPYAPEYRLLESKAVKSLLRRFVGEMIPPGDQLRADVRMGLGADLAL
jgi:hypothetical protein